MDALATEHLRDLMTRMHSMQKSGDLCDLTLTSASGSKVKMHKVVLRSCCPPMTSQKLDQDAVKKMEEFSAEVVEAVVHFMYTGEVQAQGTTSRNCASAFQAIGLVKAAEKGECFWKAVHIWLQYFVSVTRRKGFEKSRLNCPGRIKELRSKQVKPKTGLRSEFPML